MEQDRDVAGSTSPTASPDSPAEPATAERRSAPQAAEGTPAERVRGKVVGLVKGGFEVDLGGRPGLCSSSHIDTHRPKAPSDYIGREFEFLVRGEDDAGRVVLSRRRLAREESQQRLRDAKAKAVPGAILSGRVVRLADFGAFVDLGGVEGLLHRSEISHVRVDDASQALTVGQEVRVKVRKAAGKRLSLSMKALEGDPWKEVAQRFKPRTVVAGRVTRVAEFGAFLELAPGVEGLLHVSELPRGALEKLGEAVGLSASLTVLVLEVDRRKRRIALAPAPPESAVGDEISTVALKPRQVVTAQVDSVRDFGVVVRFSPGQSGVVPNAEMGTPRGTDHARDFPPGTEITVEVMSVEKGGRRSRLSRARAIRREEREEIERHARTQDAGPLSTLGDLLRAAERKQSKR